MHGLRMRLPYTILYAKGTDGNTIFILRMKLFPCALTRSNIMCALVCTILIQDSEAMIEISLKLAKVYSNQRR